MEIDLSKLTVPQAYHWMIDTIVPRPIAFISTVNGKGVGNLAPFSYFNAVSTAPPVVMVSITQKRDGSEKDTLRNILETKQFVINSAQESLAAQINQCSAEYPSGVDEMQKVGLTPIASVKVRAPRVKESIVQLECELVQTVTFGKGPGASTAVFGKILLLHVQDDCIQNGRLPIANYQPLARLGGQTYARVRDVFDLPRPII
jgi:flavin reductase (DIM6/NTAB) family NADH-FMN oxidoreductase RutF